MKRPSLASPFAQSGGGGNKRHNYIRDRGLQERNSTEGGSWGGGRGGSCFGQRGQKGFSEKEGASRMRGHQSCRKVGERLSGRRNGRCKGPVVGTY